MNTQEIIDKIRPIFQSYMIPDAIWIPIMYTESSGPPTDLAVTPTEISKGLFQINIKAHPQYAGVDLYDPVTNATIAARDFIAPAYSQAQKLSADTKTQALITYSGLKDPYVGVSSGYLKGGAGIRPKWTAGTMARFLGYYDKAAGVPDTAKPDYTNVLPQQGTPSTATTTAGSATTTGSAGFGQIGSGFATLNPFQQIIKVIALVILSIIALIAIFKMLPVSAQGGIKSLAPGKE